LTFRGAIATKTGAFTGRAARDKFVVRDAANEDKVWWNEGTKFLDPDAFTRLRYRMMAYLQTRDLYVQDCYLGADPEHRLKVRVISEFAWHSLFADTMLIRKPESDTSDFTPQLTIVHAPTFMAIPQIDSTRTEAFVVTDLPGESEGDRGRLPHGTVLIGGTAYAGEIKKSAFSALNYLLPEKGVLPMHAAANVCAKDPSDVCVFFGLSGTGKTTLSTEAGRRLIGDDEHGWSDKGIFNFEGGCYAKAVGLKQHLEPEIYAMTQRFGTILENVVIDGESRRADFMDDSVTQNTRIAYPIDGIENVVLEGKGDHPKNVIFLTCDAFGVMPPIAKLTNTQAMYHFMSGYTAKVAGTEAGVTEPQATFSACFGEPFMLQHPLVYAKLLEEKLKKYNVNCWLVNTGWSKGSYPEGERLPIDVSRACVKAAMSGELANGPMRTDTTFGFAVPREVPGVNAELMTPDITKEQADKLANLFRQNWRTKFPSVQCEGFSVSRAALIAKDAHLPRAKERARPSSPKAKVQVQAKVPVGSGGVPAKMTGVTSRGVATAADSTDT
jgi:phosphoenolpyruvate carboxykinase (ATP)